MTLHDHSQPSDPVPPTIPEPTPVPEPEAPEPAESIKDHAAQFSAKAQQEAKDDLTKPEREAVDKSGKFAKHRAPSQYASPEDVQEINRLTKELRTKEQEVAKFDPDELAGSARLRVLRRQIKALDTRMGELAPKPAGTPRETPKPAQTATEFTAKKPDINDFANDPDPVAAWTEAMMDWKADQREFTRQQTQVTEAQQREHMEVADKAIANLNEFAKAQPDFQTVTADFISKRELPPVLLNAIIRSDKQGAFVYHLAQHPELADELVFLTDGKPLNDAHVATVQRRLTKELQGLAVPTRSAPPPRPFTPPTPPNLVRTGPVKADDEPPGEGASIADHKRFYANKRG